MTKETVSESEAVVEKNASTDSKPNKKPKSAFTKKLRSLFATKKRRILVIGLAVVVILAVIFAIPASRYAVAGLVVKKSTTITVTDVITKKPVTEVAVTLAGKTSKTNSKGEATFSAVPVGQYQLKLDKKYYQSVQRDITVPILSVPTGTKLEIKATGRTVVLKVTNKIGSSPLDKATVKVSDTSAVTDKNGEASVVLPIGTKPQTATVERDGFNAAQIELTVTTQDNQKADVALAPAGKVFYLSKRTGKINVVKSNLDGTNQEVVVNGTGEEDDAGTVLLASRDWKYLALLARRDGDKAKLYLINTATSKLTVMDEGSAIFEMIGWSDNRFIYKVTRQTANVWDDKREALKSYNADTAKITTLDQTTGAAGMNYGYVSDYIYETLGSVYILDDLLVYAKNWGYNGYWQAPTNKSAIMSVKPTGENKQRLKEFSMTLGNSSFITGRLYGPQEVYFRVNLESGGAYYEYENGKLVSTKLSDSKFFNDPYPPGTNLMI